MAFTREETSQQVCALIQEKLNKTAEEVVPSATLQELGADSLDIVELIMSLEETFGIAIKDEEAEHLTTVESLIAYVLEKRTK